MEIADLKLQNVKALLWHHQHGWKWEDTDIYIQQGKIAQIGLGHSLKAKKILEFPHLKILPGLIDSQVHFREPGFEHKEDLNSGSKAALLGGITTVFEMPNTNPPTINLDLLNDKFHRAQNRMYVNYAFYGGGAQNNSKELILMENHCSCPGIKIFMGSSFGPMLVDDQKSLETILLNTRKRLTIHAESEAILQKNKIDINPTHVSQHPVWRSVESCLTATKLAVTMARRLNRKVHILHITSADEVNFLKNNSDVSTFEVLPQHLTFSAPECYEKLGTLVQQNPPIRESHHQIALWEAVNKGWVKTLGSDHAPHTLEEKSKPYPHSPSGIPGVQTLLPIMLNHVNNQKLRLERLVELMTLGVIEVFGIKHKGIIAPGFDADFTIIDLDKEWTIQNNLMASKSHWTPFHNMKVKGYPFAAIIGGVLAMQEGEILTSPQGQPAFFNS